MRYVKSIFLIVLFVLASTYVFSDTNLYLFGKGNFKFSAGSEDDYIEGENDFPMSSNFKTLGFGFGLTGGSRIVFFGLEAQYNLSGTTTLTDPSDDDTVDIDTYTYATALLQIGFNIFQNSNLRFYINGGGGVSFAIGAETKNYITRLGYDAEIDVPDKKYPITAFGGAGLVLKFSSSMGVLFSGRFQYMALDEPLMSVIVLAGLNFDF